LEKNNIPTPSQDYKDAYKYYIEGDAIPCLMIKVEKTSWFSLMGIKLFWMGITGKYKIQEYGKYPQYKMASFIRRGYKKTVQVYKWSVINE
jgi:hypothetical protein